MIIILRQVFVLKDGHVIYQYQFGETLEEKYIYDLYNVIKDEINHALISGNQEPQIHEFYKYRLCYIANKEFNLVLFFITSLGISALDIETELKRCIEEFTNYFSDILKNNAKHLDKQIFNVFESYIYTVHKKLRPKVSIVGFGGVGKTTITQLIKNEEIPMVHVPTMNVIISPIKIGNLYYSLWDFSGQEEFEYLWNRFVKGSDAVLIVTDSSLGNVEQTKYFIDLAKEEAPHAGIAIIANKQDRENALSPPQIQLLTEELTYGMVAIDTKNREKMIQILADILRIDTTVSPLLQSLFLRDMLVKEAELALQYNDLKTAIINYEIIAQLCDEMRDFKMGAKVSEQVEKLKQLYNSKQEQEPKKLEDLKKQKLLKIEETKIAERQREDKDTSMKIEFLDDIARMITEAALSTKLNREKK